MSAGPPPLRLPTPVARPAYGAKPDAAQRRRQRDALTVRSVFARWARKHNHGLGGRTVGG